MATWSPLPASTCRSTQLYATFSFPPTNHLANGLFDQSSIWFHSRVPVSRVGLLRPEGQPVGLGLVVRVGLDVRVRGESPGGGNRRSLMEQVRQGLVEHQHSSYVLMAVVTLYPGNSTPGGGPEHKGFGAIGIALYLGSAPPAGTV